ncbi:GNAT family N-acetyltransferase [Lacrimispora sp.]|uniref:GNAT family N-acetyltransferase n=1 Tax=Lacrimispora sp. TaxID=2719234 RepID=UPI00399524B8
MHIELLSRRYKVKRLEEFDIPQIYDLCKDNSLYYQYCPPFVTHDSIKEDLNALPQGKTNREKYFVGFYQDNMLMAVLDVISGYPNEETAYIGFFMVSQQAQNKGIGTAIITEVCQSLKEIGFSYIRLAYVKGNPQSQAFWIKNNFKNTGKEAEAQGCKVVVLQKNL